MKNKRDIFAELTEGFDALKSQRDAKLMALRDAAKLGFDAIERGEYLALQSDRDIVSCVQQTSRQVPPPDSVSRQTQCD